MRSTSAILTALVVALSAAACGQQDQTELVPSVHPTRDLIATATPTAKTTGDVTSRVLQTEGYSQFTDIRADQVLPETLRKFEGAPSIKASALFTGWQIPGWQKHGDLEFWTFNSRPVAVRFSNWNQQVLTCRMPHYAQYGAILNYSSSLQQGIDTGALVPAKPNSLAFWGDVISEKPTKRQIICVTPDRPGPTTTPTS